MPYLTLSNPTTNSCDYEVYLSNPFNTTYYKELRITSTNYGSSTSSVSGYSVSVIAKSSPSKYVIGKVTNGMSAGKTYTLYAYAQAQNGTWYLAGSDSITTQNVLTSKTLNMPACHNQRYVNYSVYFNQYCCGACSVAHIAEYYSQSAYSNDILEVKLKDAGVISDTYYGATWAKCPSGKIGSEQTIASNSALYSLIKNEIDADRPVIIKQTGSAGRQHYVVAYKYINSAQTDSDIFVLDSANLTQGTKTYKDNPEYPEYSPYEKIEVTTYAYGQSNISLKASASYNNCPTYSKYMTTSR